MKTYQIIIAQEKRVPVMKTTKVYVGRFEEVPYTEEGEEFLRHIQIDENDPAAWEDQTSIAEDRRTPFVETGQLHCMSTVLGKDYLTNDNILYVAEWDGGPFVKVLKGVHADRKLGFTGWPMLTEEEYPAWLAEQARVAREEAEALEAAVAEVMEGRT